MLQSMGSQTVRHDLATEQSNRMKAKDLSSQGLHRAWKSIVYGRSSCLASQLVLGNSLSARLVLSSFSVKNPHGAGILLTVRIRRPLTDECIRKLAYVNKGILFSLEKEGHSGTCYSMMHLEDTVLSKISQTQKKNIA